MIGKLKRLSSFIRPTIQTLVTLNQRFDEIKIGQGLILTKLNLQQTSKDLRDYEFKVFSQWGEDGIIQKLINSVVIKNKTFIEFGVEDFYESNCRFLLMKDNWQGFVIDGSAVNIQRARNSFFFWKHQLETANAFITRDNIDNLLRKSGFDEDLGILSIDLDGNDYFILEAITTFKPRILILEYNSVFGSSRKISVPYREDFYRTAAHFSNLYFGASLAALTFLARRKGYALVGTTSTGGNAFFVRKDLLTDSLRELTVEEAYQPSMFRESRDASGRLTYIGGTDRLDAIRGLPVLEVERQVLESL